MGLFRIWVVVANWQTEPACQLPTSAFKLGFTIRHHYKPPEKTGKRQTPLSGKQ